MASMAAPARAAHLDAASQALLASSPAVSAYLQTQRTGGYTTSKDPSTLQACLSCGTLLITGWNASRTRASKPTRQDRIARDRLTSCRIKCSPCGTIQHLRVKISTSNATISKSTSRSAAPSKPQKPPPASPRHAAAISPAPGAVEQVDAASVTPEEPNTTSSKKRSRSKKSTSNLQAMLANRNAPTNPRNTGFGLGLGDFIK